MPILLPRYVTALHDDLELRPVSDHRSSRSSCRAVTYRGSSIGIPTSMSVREQSGESFGRMPLQPPPEHELHVRVTA